MSVKSTLQRQHQRAADGIREGWKSINGSQWGKVQWISTIRNALGMNGPQLARRMGITKSAVYQLERLEQEGGVTLRKMHEIAAALDAKFVYAIVPNNKISDTLYQRAREKAKKLVLTTNGHMALENQALDSPRIQEQIEILTQELMLEMPSDLWDDA